ncbi:hypothetical protein VP01_194g1 [Puccinia sorghi]|uniref:Uncharacterized protein n=1 Tax=Puccinia sorghi TaxID=27349 RepID=A0A0L6VC88_9BASI|nr:hypothetical protein VP01_194g1 [Puccinia sorghi]
MPSGFKRASLSPFDLFIPGERDSYDPVEITWGLWLNFENNWFLQAGVVWIPVEEVEGSQVELNSADFWVHCMKLGNNNMGSRGLLTPLQKGRQLLYVALIKTLILPSYKPVFTSTKLQARAFVMGLQRKRIQICIAHCYTLVTVWHSAHIASLFGVVVCVLVILYLAWLSLVYLFLAEPKPVAPQLGLVQPVVDGYILSVWLKLIQSCCHVLGLFNGFTFCLCACLNLLECWVWVLERMGAPKLVRDHLSFPNRFLGIIWRIRRPPKMLRNFEKYIFSFILRFFMIFLFLLYPKIFYGNFVYLFLFSEGVDDFECQEIGCGSSIPLTCRKIILQKVNEPLVFWSTCIHPRKTLNEFRQKFVILLLS